jgi:alkanesulfonate monooxygenase SsuD/methylene tetrahydromethanopterin reductase-like flavin-dependent oxidoreductase (luciferase family)
VELFANLSQPCNDPAAWALERESEGWDGVACADHYFSVGRAARGFPHVWTSLGGMAAATSRVRLQPAFGNNLLRSPVEFAQAMLMLQSMSGGRAEAGLGAGWAEVEVRSAGLTFPDGPTRARMLHEALQIVRELLRSGTCQFEGDHYTIDVPVLGPLSETPPPLVASVGGPWTMKHITPLVDRVELAIGRATRGGVNDLPTMATATLAEVKEMVGLVREVSPGIAVSLLAFVAVGTGPDVDKMATALGDGLYGQLVGEPAAVADALRRVGEEAEVDRLQITAWTPPSYEALAPALFG